MRCPNCGCENEASAWHCDLCQFVIGKEPAPTPPPACSPVAEPSRLSGPPEINALMLLALKHITEKRHSEAERLMARLYAEAPPNVGRELLLSCGDAWARVTRASGHEKSQTTELIAAAAVAAGRGNLEAAWNAAQGVTEPSRDATPEAYRLQLLLLGIQGAAKAPRR